MTRFLPLALFLAGCAPDVEAQVPPLTETTSCELSPALEPIAQQLVTDAVDANAIADVTVVIQRESDGAILRVDRGSPPARYVSASSGKPVAMALFLYTYTGDLMDRVVDVLPGYSATATGEHRQTEVRHLLSFTSSITTGPDPSDASTMCWRDQSVDVPIFLACVDSLPANPANNPTRANGRWLYNMHAMDTISAIVMTTSGLPWDLPDSTHGGPDGGEASIWANFQRATGLFSAGAASPEWERSTVRIPLAAGDLEDFTAEEYLAFIRAVDRCELDDGTPFLPGLCHALKMDAITHWTDPRSLVYSAIGEAWHWTLGGWWVECRSPVFDCSRPEQISTVGRGGQYATMGDGFRVVVGPTLPAVWPGQSVSTMNGALLFRAIEDEVRAWAALGGP